MQDQYKKLPLRNGVGIVLLNKENKVFVARRIDNPKKFWQMPQGGVDKNENFYEAALRELKEETSITNVSLIKEIEGFTIYYLPNHLLGIIWRGKYKGQKQKWYVLRFNGEDSEININTKKPEFLSWRWIKIDNLTDVVVDFKHKVYEKLKKELKKILLIYC
tara:strand:- start:30 stop:515 length:486 start_codon:yes stop_codon:yes gene_type:complete